ncbi:MAG: formate dehydrogenase accessory protein FdhE [Burkholderiales bacterium]|nr:formate dehydrogenase accessory protein FdhE [Burkholderiales bacterium]
MPASTIRIVAQGEIGRGTPDPPWLELPDPASVFARCAARLGALAAAGHPDAGFLGLMQRLATAQQVALDAHTEPPSLDAQQRERCRRQGMPLLSKNDARDAAWRDALRSILSRMDESSAQPVRQAVRALQMAPADELESIAERVLDLDYPDLDPALVPFVAAALQVHWVARARALGAGAFARMPAASLCPVCGSVPLAGVLKLAPVAGVR